MGVVALVAWVAVLMLGAGVGLAAGGGWVWWRHRSPTAVSLAVVLLAVAWWALTYALELAAGSSPARGVWGDLKYAGTAVVGPAWLVFVLQYTGRGRLVTWPRLALLALEPVLIMLALAFPATHDQVRRYLPSRNGLPVIEVGPAFWVHLAYANLLVVAATTFFVATLARLSRYYWRLSAALAGAALLPWAANLAHNFELGPFARMDLTPLMFTVTGGVLIWGLERQGLVNLRPIARDLVVDSMSDALLCLDAFGHLVEVNRAGAELLGRSRAELTGRPLHEVLPAMPGPEHPPLPEQDLLIPVDGVSRRFELRRQPVLNRRGGTAGQVLVLRDVTDARAARRQLLDLLAEQSAVAAALEASLRPSVLPQPRGLAAAASYHPAAPGRQVGGDFYDLFPLPGDCWGLVLGDVSGKGAEAAAVTALVRYTLRAFAADGRSAPEVLARVGTAIRDADTTGERFATLAYATLRPGHAGWNMTLCLGGHPRPMLRRANGEVSEIGCPGTALGLFDETDLHPTEHRLDPGDLLCLFTDGLTEARQGGEMFGETGVRAVLAASGSDLQRAAAALPRAASDFRGGPLADDLAVLCLGALATPAPLPPAAAAAAPGAAPG